VVLAVLAVCVSARHVLYNRRGYPKNYDLGGPAAPSTVIHFMVALTQQNKDSLEQTFWAVADPQSPQYQNFLSADEILDVIAPSRQNHDAVVEWLRSHGITDIISMRDSLFVDATVEQAESLLHTQFFTFYPQEGGQMVVRSLGEYSVPHAISPLVDLIDGVSNFPLRKYRYKVHRAAPNVESPGGVCVGTPSFIPESLAVLYEVPTVATSAYPETSIGVIEFQGQNFDPSDLSNWGAQIGEKLPVVSAAHTVGPNDPTNPQIESTLDIEVATGINPASVPWFWLGNGNDWLLPTFTAFYQATTVPQAISVSYGWSESDQCDIDPSECNGIDSEQYVARVNTEFQKIGMRGVSIMVSSGDSGANGRTDPDCTLTYLKPDYPTASPYITSVGATQINNPVCGLKKAPQPLCGTASSGIDCISGGTEVAVSYDVASFASGGGFSNYAPQPSYQQKAVAAYLNSGVALPPSGYFNATNRGYPDVAAIGTAVLIYQAGIQSVGGTSCSSPEFAGIVGILNHYAIKASGKPLGFLNPFLYQTAQTTPSAFHDITVGDNKCTEDGCSATCQGFMCAVGWDPVTGLGSPNTATLIKAAVDAVSKHHH